VRREPIGSVVLKQLRLLITSGEWTVGGRIPSESQLAAQLGVGRSTVREAIRALTHSGLLEAKSGDGTYVRSSSEVGAALSRHLSGAHLLEIYEVRKALEVEAARLASGRRTPADLDCMEEGLRARLEARAGGSTGEFLDADMRFHRAVVAAARNPILSTLYEAFMASLRDALVPVVDNDLQVADTDELHRRLYESIKAGDAEAAVAATQEHLASTANGLAVSHGVAAGGSLGSGG
jgi:DNA-binding FadR family transcriptional regulator